MNHPKVEVLDQGYVQLIETWGSDENIIASARMSTNKSFLGWGPKHAKDCIAQTWDVLKDGLDLSKNSSCNCEYNTPGDEKLLRFLYENNHSTPFEMAGMTIEVQAPIFVFREWHRHRTQGFSEMSARYTPLPNFNYMPSFDNLKERTTAGLVTTNKQAKSSGKDMPDDEYLKRWLTKLHENYQISQNLYEMGLMMGIPKELARLPLPVARYSRMRATANLRNWLGFLTLRMAPNAQYEIRVYANEVGNLIKQSFPRTYELFEEKFNGVRA